MAGSDVEIRLASQLGLSATALGEVAFPGSSLVRPVDGLIVRWIFRQESRCWLFVRKNQK